MSALFMNLVQKQVALWQEVVGKLQSMCEATNSIMHLSLGYRVPQQLEGCSLPPPVLWIYITQMCCVSVH